jgi:hypothetical protein
MKITFFALTAFVVAAVSGCSSCDEEASSEFFRPAEFGEYRYEPEPDIAAATLIDFGRTIRGEPVTKSLVVRNVGRLDLVVTRMEISGAGFQIADAPDGEWTAEPGDGRLLQIRYAGTSTMPVRGELAIESNDPDEPIHRVVLLANQTEPCIGTIAVDAPIWHVHDGEGPMCWPEDSPAHGHEAEYQYATIPEPDDPGWSPEPDDDIEFERRSTLCGFECDCRNGGDFTYFQAFLFVPEGAEVERYHVEITDVDDGARVTVFNDQYPAGITDPQAYARLFGRTADADLASYLRPGENRIVITQVDDCCSISRLRGVTINADDAVIDRCR